PSRSSQGMSSYRFRVPVAEPTAANQVEWEMFFYYHQSMRGDLRVSPFAGFCFADQGDFCLEGDWESGCRLLRCHSDGQQARFVARLAEIAREYPHSPSAVGQATYAAIRLEHWEVAEEVVEFCAPQSPWWCHLARGYVLHRTGRTAEAEEPLRRGLEGAPADLRCRLEDIHFLLPAGTRNRYDDIPCEERDGIHRQVWWLADPFHIDPGNDRWAEHISRRFELLFHEQRLRAVRFSGGRPRIHTRAHERYWVMRGPPDSWLGGTSELGLLTSRKSAASHYVPEALSLDGLDGSLAYQLKAGERDEGYTRRDGATSEVPAQVARFREGDSLMVALASDLSVLDLWGDEEQGNEESTGPPRTPRTTPLGRAHFVASEGPGHTVSLEPSPIRTEVVFAGLLANRIQLLGLEILTPSGTARHRRPLMPLDPAGPAISDLLLFRPLGPELPVTRLQAMGMMLPSMRVGSESPLGVYWEAYGIDPEDEIHFTWLLEARGGGLLNRLSQAVRVAGGPPRQFTWTEPMGEGAPPHRAITLQLGGIGRGDYDLTLEMALPDGQVLSRTVRIEVVDSG
ncbi:hypothetical protein ACFL0I_00415, partial [Gemmatimonadota bacterium]